MAIQNTHFPSFQNDEHFEFCTNFVHLVNAIGAEKLKIAAPFATYLGCYGNEDEALKKIMKSDLTRKIHEADRERDVVFRGMAEANRSALNHFKPSVREAAIRLQIVFDTYGNVTKKAVSAETSAVYNLLTELMHKHEADMELVGLNPWAEELHGRNGAVEKLLESRYDESAERDGLNLREARLAVDEAYRVITMCVETYSVVETGETQAACKDFIARLNAIIERANTIVAQRKGRAAAKKAEEEAAKPKPDAPAE